VPCDEVISSWDLQHDDARQCVSEGEEGDDPLDRAATARLIMDRPQELVNARLEQITLVAEVRVERRPANVRAVEDLPDGNRGVRLLAGIVGGARRRSARRSRRELRVVEISTLSLSRRSTFQRNRGLSAPLRPRVC
jgi:hypothetical protein